MTDVFLTPNAGHDVAALCESAAAQLTAHTQAVAELAAGVHDGWLGDCEEGRGWARLLQEKAVGTNSLRWLLQRHAANLTDLAGQFRFTTRPYGEADDNVLGGQWPQ